MNRIGPKKPEPSSSETSKTSLTNRFFVPRTETISPIFIFIFRNFRVPVNIAASPLVRNRSGPTLSLIERTLFFAEFFRADLQ